MQIAPTKKKKLFWSIAALLVLAPTALGAWFFYRNDPDNLGSFYLTVALLGVMLGLVAYASRRPTKKKRLFWSIAAVLVLALTVLDVWYPGGVTNLPVLREVKVRWYAMQLESDDPKIQASAARALGEMGPKAKSAVPALREMLKSKSVRDNAARALRKIGAEARFVPSWSDVPGLIDELNAARHPSPGSALGLSVVSASLGEFRLESESDLEDIMDALDHSKPKTRMLAAWALGKIGIQSKPAVPKLLDLLRDKDPSVSVEAAQALKKIEPEAFQKVIPSLITELKEKDPATRVAAARILGNIGRPAEPALPHLKEIIISSIDAGDGGFRRTWYPDGTSRYNETSIHWQALQAIMVIEWPLSPTLLEMAIDPNIRRASSLASSFFVWVPMNEVIIGRYGFAYHGGSRKWKKESGSLTPPWYLLERNSWNSEIHGERSKEGGRVVLLPPYPGSVSALLIIAAAPVSKEGNEVINKAARRLRETVSDHPNPVVRALAAEMLGEIGPRAASAEPALLNAVRDQDDDVRNAAVVALNRVAPATTVEVNKVIIPRLIDALKTDTDPQSRSSAAETLAKIDSKQALPLLIDALKNDTDPQVRSNVAKTLATNDPDKAIPHLIDALKNDPDANARMGIAKTLGEILNIHASRREVQLRIGHELQEKAMPVLIDALKNDADWRVRRAAILSLWQIGYIAHAVPVQPLIDALKNDSHPQVRIMAANVLARAKEAIPALTDAMNNDTDGLVRINAAVALGRKATPLLIDELENDTDPQVRANAAKTLAALRGMKGR